MLYDEHNNDEFVHKHIFVHITILLYNSLKRNEINKPPFGCCAHWRRVSISLLIPARARTNQNIVRLLLPTTVYDIPHRMHFDMPLPTFDPRIRTSRNCITVYDLLIRSSFLLFIIKSNVIFNQVPVLTTNVTYYF